MKNNLKPGYYRQWLTPVISATWEVEKTEV
jgi:hypothetical protein